MYLTYGCPHEYTLENSSVDETEELLDICQNSSGSLLAVATTDRVVIWSTASEIVPLGGIKMKISFVPGNSSLLWKKDSTALAAVTSNGRLLICTITHKKSNRQHLNKFTMPDWLEGHYPSFNKIGEKNESNNERFDSTVELILKDLPDVILDSSITAICASRFGQHLLIGTENGNLCEVSWLGEILTRYKIGLTGLLSPSMQPNEGNFPDNLIVETENLPTGIMSLSYNDTLQLLALVTKDGTLSICTLIGGVCCIRNISSASNENIAKMALDNVNKNSSELVVISAKFSNRRPLLAVALENSSILLLRIERFIKSNSTDISKNSNLREELDENRNVVLNPKDATELAEAALEIQIASDETKNEADSSSSKNKGMTNLEAVEIHQIQSFNASSFTQESYITSLAFSSNGKALAVGHEGCVVIWSTDDGTRLSCTSVQNREKKDESCLRGIAWETNGHRLFAAVNDASIDLRRIVIFDMFQRSGSSVSEAKLCLNDRTRLVTLESRPWDPHFLHWKVFPCHGGYMAANAPLKHVSTSSSGKYMAVAGTTGMAIYSTAQEKWRIFGNVQQEKELHVSGMCWWGDEAVVILCKKGSHYWLRLYPRTHLDDSSMLIAPIRLPVGLKPSFFNSNLEPIAGEKSGSCFRLLVASQRSLMVYEFRCATNLLRPANEQSDIVTHKILFQNTLPHVNVRNIHADDDMDDSNASNSRRESRKWSLSSSIPTNFWEDGEKRIGAPKKLFILPDVKPLSLAILDYDGNLATLNLEDSNLRYVKSGVTSVIDLTSMSKAWDDEEKLLVNPCYLIQHRIASKWTDGEFRRQFSSFSRFSTFSPYTPNKLNGEEHGFSEDYEVWFPLLEQSENKTAKDMILDQKVFADPESMGLGLLENKGCLVYITQLACKPKFGSSKNESLKSIRYQPCYEMRTRLRPLLHIVLKHLLTAVFDERTGFEMAAKVLQRIRKDVSLADVLPDTLELLLRGCLESCHMSNKKGSDGENVRKVASEALSGALKLCLLGGDCFLEVVARVSRKMEPEWYSLIFPLSLDTENSEEVSFQYENHHPTHLFHASLTRGKLDTAAWFLPLINQHMARLARSREEKALLEAMPGIMSPLLSYEWKFGLGHALCCCLFLKCLKTPSFHHMLPEIWLFASKLENSAMVLAAPSSDLQTVQNVSNSQEMDRKDQFHEEVAQPSLIWRIGQSIFGSRSNNYVEVEEEENDHSISEMKSPPKISKKGEMAAIIRIDGSAIDTDHIYSNIIGKTVSEVLSYYIWVMFAGGKTKESVETFDALVNSNHGKDAGLKKEVLMANLRPIIVNSKKEAKSMLDVLCHFLEDVRIRLGKIIGRAGQMEQADSALTKAIRYFETVRDLAIRVGHTEIALVASTLIKDRSTVIALLASSEKEVNVNYGSFLDGLQMLELEEDELTSESNESNVEVLHDLILLKEWGVKCQMAASKIAR